MEYKEFAYLYDKFYLKKDYKKEVEFLKNFIKKDDNIIDIGCGTGIHASILENDGYKVDGLDLNKEMLSIAKTRLNSNLYNQNILDIKIDKKYNVIISMFAVINHLKNINELEKALINLKNILETNGVIIIDLHNPNCSGSKEDVYENIKRTMTWNYDESKRIEKTEIIFEIDNLKYKDNHIFKIFSIEEVKEICGKVGLNVIAVYENYDVEKIGNEHSKNLQFLIKMEDNYDYNKR